ncbi:MAG TPA: Trm112 family protein, partial [Longimicrobium sp.]|nr:Trm112 family protein [Longimicrobium sp.]
MHILLTDILTCPRCGPELGLILLADRLEERRVVRGSLGCSNCREMYPIEDGTVDLRVVEGAPSPAAAPDADGAVRLAALLGLAGAAGTVLVAGPGAELAPAIAALVPGLQVVAFTAHPVAEDGTPGVSSVAGGPALPVRGGMLRGVALTGGETPLAEAVRVLAPGTRLVLDPAPEGASDELRRLGAEVLLEQDGVV